MLSAFKAGRLVLGPIPARAPAAQGFERVPCGGTRARSQRLFDNLNEWRSVMRRLLALGLLVAAGQACSPSFTVAHGGSGAGGLGEAGAFGHNAESGAGPSPDSSGGYGAGGAPSATCGDGKLTDSAGNPDGCDDGNLFDGDGCSARCQLEPGFVCNSAEPTVCVANCGDTLVLGAEAEAGGCDDGNRKAGDGCDANCRVESGWACAGEPSRCAAGCGDGEVLGTERCDDGNDEAGDGCSACQIEKGYTCQGSPSVCMDIDECATKTATCDPHASCTNSVGSFTCTCKDGYSGNGLGCIDINECANGTHDCSSNAVCANTSGSFSCSCRNGYTGNGVSCSDVNECTDGTDNCSSHAVCANTPGSFTCTCKSGYSGNGINCNAGCGDGAITGSEACDDGNDTANDGCSSNCQIEPGYACEGEPSYCVVPGDGNSCSGTSGTFQGCRGSGCSVCSELVAGYACYFKRHPLCLENPGCAGGHYTCNPHCPAPSDADKC